MSKSTSHTLLERVRNSDREAWHRLHFLYEPLIRYWGSRWGVSEVDRDDLVQDVFSAISTSLPSFRHEGEGNTFRGWLRSITRFKAIDLARKRSRQPLPTGGTDAQKVMGNLPDPFPEIQEDPQEETAGLYRRAMQLVRNEFEEKTWNLFWRAAIDGHPVDLIASESGVTSATVRKAKSRVLRRLKEEIGDVID